MSECIEWTGSRDKDGYGRTFTEGQAYQAHVLTWISFYGPVPDGMLVMHTCDNPPCINIDHLQLGTHATNAQDRDAKGRGSNQYRGATHCVHGHEFTPENTMANNGGKRRCRTCKNEQAVARRAVTHA